MGRVRPVRRRRGRITRRSSLWLESKRSLDASGCLVRLVASLARWRGIGISDSCSVV